VPGVEQPELHLDVLARGLDGFARRTHRVVEGQAQIPDRIPDLVGDPGELAGRQGAVVEQQQIEVAARGELAAPVPADGDEGHAGLWAALRVRGGGVQQRGQPAVGHLGQLGAARRPGRRPLGEEAQPGRRVALGCRISRVRVLVDPFGHP
jgi:hypothetical protein